MILQTRYVIAVPNLDQSLAFYRDVLGFQIHEIGDSGWRLYALDNCTILAGECPDAIPPSELGDHSYFAYLVLDDIDDYYRRVSAAGASIVKVLKDEPWGMREFGLRTIDGHRIMLGRRIVGRADQT